MKLDLNTIIPSSDKRWSVINNIIYYKKYVNIPILKLEDDIIWVSLDRRYTPAVVKIIKKLSELNLDFYLINRINFHVQSPDNIELDITNYLESICDPRFYDGVSKFGFNISKNIRGYINKYDCYNILNEKFNLIYGKYCTEIHDWYTNTTYYKLDREDIRDFIRKLLLNIKLCLYI